jgi:tRNA-modifying protein YgfZ
MKDFDVGLLPSRALLLARGRDAEKLLQGQLSSDLRRLSAATSPYTSLNSPKGRLLATGFLHRLADEVIALELPRAIAAATLKRLQLFVLRSEVRLSLDGDEDPALVGVFGDAALSALGLPIPTDAGDALQHGSLQIATRPGPQRRHVLIGPRSALPEVTADVSALWRAADIEAGIVNLMPETQDHFVAPTAGVETLGGIAYDKGCYTGQEVIARLHYLGQAKRRLYRLRLPAPVPPAAKVQGEDEADAVGEVADCADAPQGAIALAVLQIDKAGLPLRIGDIAVRSVEAV